MTWEPFRCSIQIVAKKDFCPTLYISFNKLFILFNKIFVWNINGPDLVHNFMTTYMQAKRRITALDVTAPSYNSRR